MSNNIIIQPNLKDGFVPYRAMITKANNGIVVINCLRQRWWWRLSEKDESYDIVNLVWSSWKRDKFVKTLTKSSNNPLKNNLDREPLKSRSIQLNKGKWSLMKKVLNEYQINKVYDYQLRSNPKIISNNTGPFIFESTSIILIKIKDVEQNITLKRNQIFLKDEF